MTRGRIDWLWKTGRRPVAPAVVRRAQVRAALEDLPWNLDRLTRIVAAFLAWPSRVAGNTARFDLVRRMRRTIPVGRPLPDVADQIEQTVPVRRKHADGRGAFVAIGRQILPRECALPGVRHVPIAWPKLVAPGI